MLTLKFDQEPDYEAVIASINKALQSYLTSKKIQHHKFEWNVRKLNFFNLIAKLGNQSLKTTHKRGIKI